MLTESGPSCGAGGKQGCRREIGLDQVPGGVRPCLRERRPGDLEQPWSVLRTPDQRDLMWARSRGAQRKLPRARSQPKHASRQGEARPKCHPLVDQDLLRCKRRSWLFRRQGPSLLECGGRHSCTSLRTESTQSKTANWPSWQAARGRDGTSVLSKKQQPVQQFLAGRPEVPLSSRRPGRLCCVCCIRPAARHPWTKGERSAAQEEGLRVTDCGAGPRGRGQYGAGRE